MAKADIVVFNFVEINNTRTWIMAKADIVVFNFVEINFNRSF